jgi:outer membrane protein OmpA-like peptidoglycan-associated protein
VKLWANVLSLLVVLAPRWALAADPFQWHAMAGGAHAVGDPQGHEFGMGSEGALAVELGRRAVGVQLEAGTLWLAHASAPADPSLADHGDGTALTLMGGVRLHPFADVAGPWLGANLGYVRTGDLDRFGFDVRAGYDWRLGQGRWDAGPYLAYLQVVQPNDALRPEDAHILSIGLHVALGAERTPPPPEPAPAAAPSPPPPPPLPPPVADAPDRDHDGVPDAEDACPDVPGVRSDDPKTNGCPPAGDEVRVVADHIEYDERILFDTGSGHVHHASWPILEKLAKFILANPDIQEVDIRGHADERGTEEFNLALSKSRADAVKYLLTHFGVPGERLTTEAYGFAKPRAVGHTENEWRQNRRVEFVITKVKDAHGGSTTLKPAGEEGAP